MCNLNFCFWNSLFISNGNNNIIKNPKCVISLELYIVDMLLFFVVVGYNNNDCKTHHLFRFVVADRSHTSWVICQIGLTKETLLLSTG